MTKQEASEELKRVCNLRIAPDYWVATNGSHYAHYSKGAAWTTSHHDAACHTEDDAVQRAATMNSQGRECWVERISPAQGRAKRVARLLAITADLA